LSNNSRLFPIGFQALPLSFQCEQYLGRQNVVPR
jgi:hypothetical protein